MEPDRTNPMLVPDRDQPRPDITVAAIRQIWAGVRIEPIQESAPAVERLLAALGATFAGLAFAQFRVHGNPEFHWFVSRDRWSALEFPERLLRAPAVAAALPDLCREPVSGAFGFEGVGAFTFAGELAGTLWAGSMGTKHAGGPGDAFNVADAFRRWLFGDRFDEVRVLVCHSAWSAWFYDIAWDHTYLIFDKGRSVVSVLAMTDTD